MTPQTRLRQNAAACSVPLTGVDRLMGVDHEDIRLASPNGEWSLTLPRSAFDGLAIGPGESVIVTIGLCVTRVEAVQPQGFVLGEGFQ